MLEARCHIVFRHLNFTREAILNLPPSERHTLNHSLEMWMEAEGCVKVNDVPFESCSSAFWAHFLPMELFAGMWGALTFVCLLGTLATLSSLRVLLFPVCSSPNSEREPQPIPGHNRERLWIVSMLNLAVCDLLRCLITGPLFFYSLSSTNW